MSNPNYTTNNKDLALTGNGNDTGAWDVPVNANFTAIDTALGGSVTIPVPTGSTSVALTLAQYSNLYISFTGTLTANVTYYLPAGTGTPTANASVAGMWILNNATAANSYTVSFASATGNYQLITRGQTALIYVSPPGGCVIADTQYAAAAAAAAQAAAITSANNTSSNAGHLSSGTVPNAQLPNIGSMPGVTIMMNPGTVPTGSAGDMWFYY